MKIGLNATCFNNRPSGAKQRFVGLYTSLFQRMPYAEFTIFEPRDCEMHSWFPYHDNVKFKKTVIPSEGRIKKFFLGLSFWNDILQKEELDYFEGFNLPSIQNPKGKTFHTIHDIRGTYREFSTWEHLLSRPAHKKSINIVDNVITVSKTMREEILAICPKAKIQVIYNGIDVNDFTNLDPKKVAFTKKKFNLPEQYILSVGHFEKRKNYGKLVDAIKILRQRNLNIPLLIVGNDNGEKEAIKNQILQEDLQDLVYIYSHLSDFEVKVFYLLSELFIFPSIYEGFGIPILESMAAKTPVITSNLKVFKEITQNQGIYFDPYQAIDIASCIENTLGSKTIRDELIQYGDFRLKDFSFNELSKKLENFYMENK